MSTDMRRWPHKFVREFIELYRSLPCLYDQKHYQYGDREAKAEAYQLLVVKLQETEPGATKDDVIKKISNMRSSYRKEQKKVRHSGSLYQPTLWYYHMLDFLYEDRQSLVKEPSDTYKENIFLKQESVEEGDDDEEEDEDGEMIRAGTSQVEVVIGRVATEHYKDSLNQPIPDTTHSLAPISTPPASDQSRESSTSSWYQTVGMKRHRTEVEVEGQPCLRMGLKGGYTSYCCYLADELDQLPPAMALYCQKLINDALFEAKCGALKRSSRIVSE